VHTGTLEKQSANKYKSTWCSLALGDFFTTNQRNGFHSIKLPDKHSNFRFLGYFKLCAFNLRAA
jgi:hypothetical protein